MVSDATTFTALGLGIALLGAYIRVRRRAGLLANYDGSADPEHAAVHGGNVVVAIGAFMVAYGVADRQWGLPEGAGVGAALVIVALAFLAAARAQGY